jgi:hypothetical protein
MSKSNASHVASVPWSIRLFEVFSKGIHMGREVGTETETSRVPTLCDPFGHTCLA